MNRRKTLFFVTLLAVAGVLAIPMKRFVDNQIWYHHCRKAADLVDTLDDRRPPDVSLETWDIATTWAGFAYHDVCVKPGYVSLSELKRFRADLERELARGVDLETIAWIRRRLAKTGPHGKAYFDNQKQLFLAEMEFAAQRDRARNAKSPSP